MCTIKWQSKQSPVRLSLLTNSSSAGNMFKLPSDTPGLFIHPPTLSHWADHFSMAHLHHSFTHNSPPRFQWLDWTWLCYILVCRGKGRVGICFISTRTCWNLTDEASCVKLCSVNANRVWGLLLSEALFRDPDIHRWSQTKTKVKQCGLYTDHWRRLHANLITWHVAQLAQQLNQILLNWAQFAV